MDFVRPDWCRRIPVAAERGAGGDAPPGLQVDSWRSDCFLAIAVKTKNTSLCGGVQPIKTGLLDGYLDGTGYNKAYCIDSVNKSNGHWGELGLLPMTNNELAPLMHQLGYTEQTLLDAGIDPTDTFSWTKYIDKLRWNRSGMPRYEHFEQETHDFLGRIDRLRCREPLAAVAWRIGIPTVIALVTLWAASKLYSSMRRA